MTERPSDPPARRRLRMVGRWAYWLLCWVFGVWVAAQLVTDFRVTGRPDQQLLAVAVVGIGAWLLALPVRLGLVRLVGRVQRWAVARLDADPFDASPGLVFVVPALAILVNLAVALGLSPLALWVATLGAHAVGLPVEPLGGWPVVVAAVLAHAVASAIAPVRAWLSGRRRVRRAIAHCAGGVLVVAALWLADVLLADVRIDAGGYPVPLVLVVLAALFCYQDVELRAPFLTTALRLAVLGLKLWATSWMSTMLVFSLHIAGFWTFVLAAVVLLVAEWVARLVGVLLLGPPQPRHDPFAAMEMHNRAMMSSMHHPPMY